MRGTQEVLLAVAVFLGSFCAHGLPMGHGQDPSVMKRNLQPTARQSHSIYSQTKKKEKKEFLKPTLGKGVMKQEPWDTT